MLHTSNHLTCTIGNRTTAGAGGDASGNNLHYGSYTRNYQNQYAQRTVPGYLDIMGIANPAQVTVTVNGNGNAVYRKGEYFESEASVANSASAQYVNANVVSTFPPTASQSGNVFLPQSPEIYQYDLDGNLTQDGRWNYTWDAENRLWRMWTLNGIAGPPMSLQFEYDWQGRRISKKLYTNNNFTGGYAQTNFVYDGWNLVAALTPSPSRSILNSFIWGLALSGSMQGAGGVGGLLRVTYNGTQTTNCFVAYDGNGNVSALVNTADGSTAAQYTYGPFGEVIRATGLMAKTDPFRFSTKYQDDETDLLYYGERFLNSTAGRWLSRDPLADSNGLQSGEDDLQPPQLVRQTASSPYSFVRNNAIGRIDLFGLCDDCCCDARGVNQGRSILQGRYAAAATYLDPYRPAIMPEEGSWSCLNVARNIGNFMKPIPPCWSCYVEER